MRRASLGALAAAAVLAAFGAALALPGGRAGNDTDAAVTVQLWSAFTPYGQRMLTGTVPALADRLELTSQGVTTIVELAPQGTLEGSRRRIELPLPGAGPWHAVALWAEHRLGSARGGPSSPRPAGSA